MDAVLGPQKTVGVVSAHHDRGALDAGFLALLEVDRLDAIAVTLRPAQVHPVEHLRPVLRLGPPSARMDREDRVAGVVLAGEHQIELGLLEGLGEVLDGTAEILLHRLPLACQFGADLRLLDLLLEGLVGLDGLGQARPLPEDLLGARLVFVEVRVGGLLIQFLEAALGAGQLKDDLEAKRNDCAARPWRGRARQCRGSVPSGCEASAPARSEPGRQDAAQSAATQRSVSIAHAHASRSPVAA